MSITFEVSDVAPIDRTVAKPVVPALDAIRSRAGRAEAAAANLGSLIPSHAHAFVQAVHIAFDDHLPLELSPDDVWLCIAQGFGQHVELHAETLRDHFVRHQGKEEIVVFRDEFVKGSADNDWPGVFGEFSDAIASRIGKQRDLVVAGFSTTGPVERAASEIVLMSAMKSYFDFTVVTRCGIPRITLLGTPEDWASIKTRARMLSEYGLEAWSTALLPVLDQLCATAAGRPDRVFWQSFYKFHNQSGGPYITGWINRLFPYIRKLGSQELTPNPAIDRDAVDNIFHQPSFDAFPSGLSIAPFLWSYLGTKIPMELVAGFVGISQDPETLAVRPAIGWAVRDAQN